MLFLSIQVIDFYVRVLNIREYSYFPRLPAIVILYTHFLVASSQIRQWHVDEYHPSPKIVDKFQSTLAQRS